MKNALVLLCLVSFGLVANASAESVSNFNADQNSKKYLLAALGDSVTSAWISDTQLKTSNFDTLLESALGGSSNKYTLSWSTGHSISSHYQRLQEFLNKSEPDANLLAENLSVPTIRSKDLQIQAQHLAQLMNKGGFSGLKYVTIAIGANDLCSGIKNTPEISDEIFSQNIKTALTTIASIQQDEPIRVLIAAIPNLPDLGKPEIADATSSDGLSCKEIHRFISSYCDNLLNWTTQEEYQELSQRVSRKNTVLKTLSENIGQEFSNLEVVFSSGVSQTQITSEMLAGDCFHPSQYGQEILSNITWNDQPWFK